VKADDPPAPEPAKADEKPTGADDEALAWIERREAASRQKIAAVEQQSLAAVEQHAAKLKSDLVSQFPAEVLEKARVLAELDGADDRTLAEYFFHRHKKTSGETQYDPDSVVTRFRKGRKEEEFDRRLSAIEERERRLEYRERGEATLQQFVSDVSDAYPHTQRWLKAYPQEAKEAIAAEAVQYHQTYGILPQPKEVLVSIEKARRTKFEALGYTTPAATPAPTAAPKEQTPATKAPAAIPSDLGSSTPTGSDPATLDELEEQVVRELREISAGKRALE
jgi:hypothetical protein